MKENVKKALENSARKAANAISNVVKTFENHGADIADEYATKVFAHLSNVLNAAHVRAQAARIIQPREFSLDAEPAPPVTLPTPFILPSPQPAEVPVMLLPRITAHPPDIQTETSAAEPDIVKPAQPSEKVWHKPEGRLVGTKEPVFATPPEKRKPKREAPEPGEIPDKTGAIVEAGFIDA
jgi:hypothetical protein